MAQTSITLLGQKSLTVAVTGTTISFNATDKKIVHSANGFGNLKTNDIVTVTNASTASNNKDYTIATVASDGSYVTTHEVTTTEGAGANISVTHSGFISNKAKGDGYYSQPDGVHTVAYHISDTLPAATTIKMQGSLVTIPTEADWFDIPNSGATPDLSTKSFTANFTGNFVWTRVKITGMTAGSITKVLFNH